MGKYFVMSKRFNKCNASDFGLVTEGTDVAIDPKDGSVWIKAALYDFGWGKENGFYKSPQPDFDTLIELALHSTDEEDKYGAASILLDKYGDELLRQCENLMNDYSKKEDFKTPDPKDLNAVLDSYIKTYDQEPPLTSAIKVKGKKLYEYQRQGLSVEIPKRKVTINDMTLLEAKDDGFSFKVKVSSGTYIRSLIRDILDDLGLIGTLVSLRRISVGSIEVKDCDKLDAILEGRYHTHSLYDVLASRYEVYEFEDDKAIRNGKKIKIDTPNDEVLIAKDKIALAIYRREDKDIFRSSRGLF